MLSHIAIQLQDIQWHDACLKFYIGDFFHKLRILSKPEQICVCVSMCHQQDVFFSSFFSYTTVLTRTRFVLELRHKISENRVDKLDRKKRINPLSPSMHIQILQIDLHTFRLRIVERISFKIKAFSFSNQFSNSHNLHSWWSADVVRRKLMLVSLGTQRINPLGTYRATSSRPVNEIVAMYEQPGTGD